MHTDDVKPVHLLAQRAVDKFTKYHHVSRTTATVRVGGYGACVWGYEHAT